MDEKETWKKLERQKQNFLRYTQTQQEVGDDVSACKDGCL